MKKIPVKVSTIFISFSFRICLYSVNLLYSIIFNNETKNTNLLKFDHKILSSLNTSSLQITFPVVSKLLVRTFDTVMSYVSVESAVMILKLKPL